jgi:hypothetical protein
MRAEIILADPIKIAKEIAKAERLTKEYYEERTRK